MANDQNPDATPWLIAFAREGKHHQFQYIRNFRDYLFIKKIKKSLQTMLSHLALSEDDLFSEYCHDVTKGNSTVDKLLTYKELGKLIDFYEEEYRVTSSVLQEFEAYMKSGHILDMLFFGERESKDLWDHRGE